MTWKACSLLVVLAVTGVACGGSEFEPTEPRNLDALEQPAISSTDPIRGWWAPPSMLLNNWGTGDSTITESSDSCWPVTTYNSATATYTYSYYWRNITYVGTVNGMRKYTAQRRRRGTCDATQINVTLWLELYPGTTNNYYRIQEYVDGDSQCQCTYAYRSAIG